MLKQKELIKFLILWAVSSLVLALLSNLFGGQIVLGNDKVTKSIAGFFSGFLFALVPFVLPQLLKDYFLKIKNENIWYVLFLIVEVILIWIDKKFSLITGFGVSNLLLVLFISVLVTLIYIFVNKTVNYFVKGND